jgi:hypothetical protein
MLRALPVRRSEQLAILNWRAKSDAPVVHRHWGSNYDEPGGGLPVRIFRIRHSNCFAITAITMMCCRPYLATPVGDG